ncbi:MAG: YkgJ family cysteine cluster protein [Phycisphaerales bacterium]|nr:YkgJ family cysteine cluster protein [Phycisphaerales bacterium]
MSGGCETTELWGCAKHAQMGKTCCQTCEILVTEGDRERIHAHTGQQDFWEYRTPSDPVYLEQDDDPNWLKWAFRPDGARAVLRRPASGDCRFLGPAGCSLPMETRPLVCRLYPFTYTERGIDGVSDGCPREVIPPGSTILQVLDMRREDADRWHAQLYAELREGAGV